MIICLLAMVAFSSCKGYENVSVAELEALINGGKVKINGTNCKPSRPLKIGEVIEVRKGMAVFTYKVLAFLEKRVGAALVAEYAENLTPQSEFDKLRAPVETFFVRRDRGAGRPTKKERRTIDALWDSFDSDED